MLGIIERKVMELMQNGEDMGLALSYTGDMITDKMLTNSGCKYEVMAKEFEKAELSEVKSLKDTDIEFSMEAVGCNRWIVDELKDRVNMDDLWRVGEEKEKYWVKYENGKFVEADKTDTGAIDQLMLDIADCGTKDELEYRKRWIMRYNFAERVNVLAKEWYDRTSRELREWFEGMLYKNKGRIASIIATGDMLDREGKSLVQVRNYDKEESTSGWMTHSIVLFEGGYGSQARSWISGKGAIACEARINISSGEDIAQLFGCKISELPLELQHYDTRSTRCGGNHILENLDPIDWVVQNYWSNIHLNLRVLISKTDWTNMRKERGLEVNRPWEKKER